MAWREGFAAAKTVAGGGCARAFGREYGQHALVRIEHAPCHAIDRLGIDAANGGELGIRRGQAVDRHRLRPLPGESFNGVAGRGVAGRELAFGGFDLLGAHALVGDIAEDFAHLGHQGIGVGALGKSRGRIGNAGIAHAVECELGAQALAGSHQPAIERAARVVEDGGEYVGGRIVLGAVAAGAAKGEIGQAIAGIGGHADRLGIHRRKLDRGGFGHVVRFDIAEQAAHGVQGLLGVDVAAHDQGSVIGRIPALVKGLEHGAGGLVERGFGAQGVVGIGRAGEQLLAQASIGHIRRAGQIAGHFLLDGAAFLFPVTLGVGDRAHALGVQAQRHVEILGRHGEVVAGDLVLGIGIELAAHGRGDGRDLGGGQVVGAAKHHVFLRMRHAGKTVRRIPRTHVVIHHRGDRGCKAVGYHDHLQAVIQRRTAYRVVLVRRCEHGQGERPQAQQQQGT